MNETQIAGRMPVGEGEGLARQGGAGDTGFGRSVAPLGATASVSAAGGTVDARLAATRARRRAEEALTTVFRRWGYEEIGLPFLLPAAGDPGWGEYRIIDQDGAVWALRPDMTGPIARLCALGDAGGPRPRRLCYLATLFRRGDEAGPREVAQAGGELIGAGGPLADAEVLALCAAALAAVGVGRYRLAVGHVGLLRQLLGSHADAAFGALLQRDFVGLDAVLATQPELRRAAAWRGSIADVLSGRSPWDDAEFNATLRLLAAAGLGDAIVVEAGLVRPGRYYTGLVFEVSAPGRARPLGGGGRYDGLAGEPATGFALDLGEVLADRSLAIGDDEAPTLVVVEPGAEEAAWRQVAELRRTGARAVLDARPVAEAARDAAFSDCRTVLVVHAEGTVERWVPGL